jgi:hypothetical protein
MSEFEKLQDHIDGIERQLRLSEAKEDYLVVSLDRDGTIHFRDQAGKLWWSKLVTVWINGKPCCANATPKVGDTIKLVPWDIDDDEISE